MTALFSPGSTLLAACFARAWLRIYAFGLPAETRERRTIELESDLWEHEQDCLARRFEPSRTGIEMASRVVRGMPADLLWRFQLEGPQMQLKIPFERFLGLLLLAMTVAVPISLSINGYDPAREGWEGELTRLGDIPEWQRRVNIVFQAASGLVLIAAGAGVLLAVQSRSRSIAGVAGFGLAASGAFTLVVSAIYSALSELATAYVAGDRGESVVVTSRTLALTMEALSNTTSLVVVISVLALVVLAWREQLLPAWMRWVPITAAGLVVVGFFAGVVVGDETATWVLLSSAFFSVIAWLLLAGGMLALGYRRPHIAGDGSIAPA